MALLNDAQQAVVEGIQEKKRALEMHLQLLNDLLRDVARRDADTSGMNPAGESGTDLIARAKAAYMVRLTAMDATLAGFPRF